MDRPGGVITQTSSAVRAASLAGTQHFLYETRRAATKRDEAKLLLQEPIFLRFPYVSGTLFFRLPSSLLIKVWVLKMKSTVLTTKTLHKDITIQMFIESVEKTTLNIPYARPSEFIYISNECQSQSHI